jgi:hypothetical protein
MFMEKFCEQLITVSRSQRLLGRLQYSGNARYNRSIQDFGRINWMIKENGCITSGKDVKDRPMFAYFKEE